MNFESFLDFVLVLIMVVFVIGLAYGTTLLIGKKSNSFMGNKNAKVLQQIALNMNFQITVIQVQQKVYIIGKTNKTMELLDTIPLDEWEENEKELRNKEQQNRKETPLERFFKIRNPHNGNESKKDDRD